MMFFIVRICASRFPDRVELQGFFHPRELAEVLYPWVASFLREQSSHTPDYADAYFFDLYTTPPRQVLESPTGSAARKLQARTREAYAEPLTLADMQLVPAAVVYVAWREAVAGRYSCAIP
jgi:hypothetical protein